MLKCPFCDATYKSRGGLHKHKTKFRPRCLPPSVTSTQIPPNPLQDTADPPEVSHSVGATSQEVFKTSAQSISGVTDGFSDDLHSGNRAPAPRTTSRIFVIAGPDSTTATPYVNTTRYAPSGLHLPAVFVIAPLIASKAGKLTSRRHTKRNGTRGRKLNSWPTKRKRPIKRQFLPSN